MFRELAHFNLEERSNMVAFLLQTPPPYTKKVSRYWQAIWNHKKSELRLEHLSVKYSRTIGGIREI